MISIMLYLLIYLFAIVTILFVLFICDKYPILKVNRYHIVFILIIIELYLISKLKL